MQTSWVDIPVMRNFSRYSLRFVVVAWLALLAACSGGPDRKPPAQGAFTPLERGGGLRLFEYTLRVALPPARAIHRTPDGNNAPQPHKQDDRALLKQAHRLLNDDPRLNDYCPNGYMTLDEYALLGELMIRGECRYEPRQEASK
jgi:hypothetical protein